MRPCIPTRGAGRSGFVLLLPIIALAAIAAGCGGSSTTASSSTTTTTPSASASSRAAARAKFTSCLEAHGVPASEATGGFGFRHPAATGSSGTATPSGSATPPTTSAAFAAAFQACRADLPAGFGRGGFQNSAAGRAYLQCLQLHGVTIPTAPSGAAGSVPPAGGFRSLASNPKFQAARSACAALAPGRGGAGSAARPSGTTSTTAAA